MKLPQWPRATLAAQGRVQTRWALRLSRPLSRDDVRLLCERVSLTDPDLDMRAEIIGRDQLDVVFTWESYDGGAMSRSCVALQVANELVGPFLDVEGRPPSDWPFLA